jgi:hypothetical protein
MGETMFNRFVLQNFLFNLIQVSNKSDV